MPSACYTLAGLRYPVRLYCGAAVSLSYTLFSTVSTLYFHRCQSLCGVPMACGRRPVNMSVRSPHTIRYWSAECKREYSFAPSCVATLTATPARINVSRKAFCALCARRFGLSRLRAIVFVSVVYPQASAFGLSCQTEKVGGVDLCGTVQRLPWRCIAVPRSAYTFPAPAPSCARFKLTTVQGNCASLLVIQCPPEFLRCFDDV